MKNLEWEQIDWLDAEGKLVFDDEVGFIRVGKPTITVDGYSGLLGEATFVDALGRKRLLNSAEIADINSLFANGISVSSGYYRQSINQKVDSIRVKLQYSPNSTSYQPLSIEVVLHSEDQNISTLSRKVWYSEGSSNEINALFQRPLFKTLKEGQAVYLKKYGKCVITKIYTQPDSKNRIVDLQTLKGETITAEFSNREEDSVYLLPYQTLPVSEFEQFNICKAEMMLSPYITAQQTILNVHWLQVNEAALYIVSLYQRNDRPYLQQVYHLKDYIVDRENGFLSITDLLGSGFIVVVKAEDRSGEIIAQSRGIAVSGNKSYPRFWE